MSFAGKGGRYGRMHDGLGAGRHRMARETRKWFAIGAVVGALAAGLVAFAAPPPGGGSAVRAQPGNAPVRPRINHVPERLAQGTRLIYPSAKEKNHVLVVNVGNALPADVFATTVTYAMSRINVNVWTNSMERSVVRELIERPERQREMLGDKAIVAVFVERNDRGVSFLNAPGHWAMLNMRGLDRDGPSAQTYRDRCAKMVLKGVAHACGVGASVDELCSLNYDSFTLKGMDKTDIRVSPMSYFPMLSTLQALGGPEIVSPAYE